MRAALLRPATALVLLASLTAAPLAAQPQDSGWRHGGPVLPPALARLETTTGTAAAGLAGEDLLPSRPSPGVTLDEPPSGSDWADVLHTGRAIWFRATHPSARQAWIFGGLALATAELQQRKLDLQGEAQEARGTRSNQLSNTLRPFGEAIVPVAALTTYFIGRWAGSDRARRAGLILSESAGFTALTTEIGQYVLSEQRPSDGGQLRYFRPGGHGISGHTSIVASMAVPLDRLFFHIQPDDGGWERFGKILGKGFVYTLPVATGWSRINDDKHYAWNVLLGLGVGYSVGSFVASSHLDEDREGRDRSWAIVPITDGQRGMGLGVRWTH